MQFVLGSYRCKALSPQDPSQGITALGLAFPWHLIAFSPSSGYSLERKVYCPTLMQGLRLGTSAVQSGEPEKPPAWFQVDKTVQGLVAEVVAAPRCRLASHRLSRLSLLVQVLAAASAWSSVQSGRTQGTCEAGVVERYGISDMGCL